MGMEHIMYLIDLKVKLSSIDKERATLENSERDDSYRFFFERAFVNDDGFLEFTASEEGVDFYDAFEDTGTVPALSGKWYEAEEIASWLKQHTKIAGGKIIFHSIEADGEALGWEFDGLGKMRELKLGPVGEWT